MAGREERLYGWAHSIKKGMRTVLRMNPRRKRKRRKIQKEFGDRNREKKETVERERSFEAKENAVLHHRTVLK